MPAMVATVALVACFVPIAPAAEPSIKHLLLDRRVVQSVEAARLVPGRVEKDPHNPLFQADRPWENALNNLYPNVVYDEEQKLFKLWYKCVLADKDAIAQMMPPSTIHDVGWYLCYATSPDGVAWQKPELGLIGHGGSMKTNIVARDVANVGVLKDPHDPDPQRRYKMIYDVGFSKLRARFSADGIHWSDPVEPQGLVLPPGQGNTGDTHNNGFWDPRQGKYLLSTRIFAGERLVARSESDDFLHWQTPRVVLRSSEKEGKTHQTYCMSAFPYAGIYLGLAMIYHAGTDRTVDCELVWSPDSVSWQRVCPGVPLIPRGPAGSYDSSCIYGQAGTPAVRDGRLMLFYGGSPTAHRGWKRHCLPCLARMRIDGFAGYEPAEQGKTGTVVTAPMVAADDMLRITVDAQGGSVQVTVLDAPGFDVPGRPIAADATDAAVEFPKSFALLRGKTVRLKFVLNNARLYAFSGLVAPPSAAEFSSFDDAMRKFLDERPADCPAIAATLAVGREGKVVFSQGYGFADPAGKRPLPADAPMRIASVGKPITAAAVRKLVREKKLALDTPAFEFLGIDLKKADPRLAKITVAQLLDHRGGWDRETSFDPMFRSREIAAALGKPSPAAADDVVRYMAARPLQFDPGTATKYSNFGYCVLGRVIEKASGKRYIEYVRQEILAPLGIQSVELGRSRPAERNAAEPWYSDPNRGPSVFDNQTVSLPDGGFCLEAMDAHGGLIASTADLCRFFMAYRMDGEPRAPHDRIQGTFFGSLPGTFSIVVQRPDGLVLAAILNRRCDSSGRDYFSLKERLERALGNH